MLTANLDWLYQMNDEDRRYYHRLLPDEHPLLDALKHIPWGGFIPDLESFYCRDPGQPAVPPLLMFKLEYLRYQCRLSDRDVINRGQTDVLFRWFLQIPVECKLPDASSLSRFRGRLGDEGFQKMFDGLVRFAREAGLVRDRLRLKDASHVLANIAVPTTLQLLAQLRERMIQAVSPFDPLAAEGFRIAANLAREETDSAADDIRLQARLDLVLDILHWITQQTAPAAEADQTAWQKLQAVRELAEKISDDCLHPEKKHRTLSVVDPDARRGKHGDYYDGYLLNIMLDPDSQLITSVTVAPADCDEARDTVGMVAAEQATHGNQIEQLSIDGIGFNGEMLRAIEGDGGLGDEGLGVEVITPPRDFNAGPGYPSTLFELSDDGLHVTCPAGEQSSYRNTGAKNGVTFQFRKSQCAGCPLLEACHPNMKPKSQFGRSVTKNEYEAEYERARQKATTAEYKAVRREHPAIERKLSEVLRHHRGRFARYWGTAKIRAQECMTCFAVNVKRMSVLFKGALCAEI